MLDKTRTGKKEINTTETEKGAIPKTGNQHTSKTTNIEWNIERKSTDAETKKEKINV